jgi:hypothetical protein
MHKRYISLMKDYISMTSQSLMTLPEDNIKSGALHSLLSFRIERSATVVQVDNALQQKFSRCFAYGINAKVNIARDVAFQTFQGLLGNFS